MGLSLEENGISPRGVRQEGVLRLVTFGDDLYRWQKVRLRREAEGTGWFDEVVVHTPETVGGFLRAHRDFVDGSRGYGYWIWKPHIILEELGRLRDGDFLFYLDCGSSVLPHRFPRLLEYLDILRSSAVPVMGFADGGSFGQPPDYKERYLQKRRALRRLGLEGDLDFLESGQVEGGIVCMMKSDASVAFVREWMDLCLEDGYSLLNDWDDLPQLDGFLCHRHDQSLLSALCKLRGAAVLGAVESYGRGPFFSSRITDFGVRPKAPDGFRREPDYDRERHHEWRDYLGDPSVGESVMSGLRGLLSSVRFSFGEDPKVALMDLIFSGLERLQFGKGLYRVSLELHEQSPEERGYWERLVGSVSCEFLPGESLSLNFVLGSSGAEFPDSLPVGRRLYRTNYSRVWDCNY